MEIQIKKDQIKHNISTISKEHKARQENRCPICGKKMKLELFFDHNDECDSGTYEEVCVNNNCRADGDFERFYY